MNVFKTKVDSLARNERTFDKVIGNLNKRCYYFYTKNKYNESSIESSTENDLGLTDDEIVFNISGTAYIFDSKEISLKNKDFLGLCLNGITLEELLAEQCKKCGKAITGRMFKNPVSSYEGYICEDCMKHYDEIAIKQYSFKPEPQFFGHSKRGMYVGCEVEVQTTSNNEVHAYKSAEISDGIGYCKSDASIGEGFEFVTHPFTLAHEIRTGKMKKVFEYFSSTAAIKAGRDDGVTACGIHIHVSRNSIPYETMKKIVSFMYKNRTKVRELSHRGGGSQLEHYASLDRLGDSDQIRALTTDEYQCGGRYSAINSTKHTFEFRLFNSTTRYSEFMSFVEFVHGIVEFCETSESDKFSDFMTFMAKYKNFTKENAGVACV